jgi:hypothetical protein
MKKVLVRTILIFLMTASIIACSKKEETTSPTSILGKWEFVNEKIKVTENGQIILDTTNIGGGFMELFSNGTGIWMVGNITSFTYTFSGTTFTMVDGDTTVFNNTNFTETTFRLGRLKSWEDRGNNYFSDRSFNFIKNQ